MGRVRLALALGVLMVGGTAAAESAVRVLFVGNSFFFGAVSSAEHYRPDSVHDLNATDYGGVPAIFKRFAEQAGFDVDVSLETVPGAGFDEHYDHHQQQLDAPWDVVIMSTYSTLDRVHPGNPASLLHYTPLLAQLFVCRNPAVQLYLNATWTRADETYLPSGHWVGQPVEAMASDVLKGYEAAQSPESLIRDVIPTGSAWIRAMHEGIADPNPYDGLTPGLVDLWATDHYHASVAGYYLEALMIYGVITGNDPAALGASERAAGELALSATLAVALQRVAHAEIAAHARPERGTSSQSGCAAPSQASEAAH